MALLLARCATGALTACSSDSDANAEESSAPASKPPSEKPSKSADPQLGEKKAVLEVYERMWEEQAKAYAKGSVRGTDLEKYATKDALGRVMGDILRMKQAGTVTKGAPSHATDIGQGVLWPLFRRRRDWRHLCPGARLLQHGRLT
ncbi:hypothetical protein [Streptomyces longisporoflavus]|uniref:Lipoprotein n=1 Tax=Streptomyces longisporoflavus TaxID=28044 RepID=A0ABW7R2D7_9ACTN